MQTCTQISDHLIYYCDITMFVEHYFVNYGELFFEIRQHMYFSKLIKH